MTSKSMRQTKSTFEACFYSSKCSKEAARKGENEMLENDREISLAEREFAKAQKNIPLIALVVFAVILILYFARFNSGFGDQAAFGEFGDFVGGALNPILGFATIWLLLKSISFQIVEFSLTRNEIEEGNRIHEENLRQQGRFFEIERYLKELDLVSDGINELMQSEACYGTKDRGMPSFKAFKKEGVDYEVLTMTLAELLKSPQHYSNKFGNEATKERTFGLLTKMKVLNSQTKSILKSLDEQRTTKALYAVQASKIQSTFTQVNDLIEIIKDEQFEQLKND